MFYKTNTALYVNYLLFDIQVKHKEECKIYNVTHIPFYQ